MELLFIIFIYIFGTIFWSFASVVISRIRNNEKWIFMWRSHCISCNNTLQARDLIPIFSYVFSRWKCRFCNDKISSLYPILEIVMWTLFALSAYFFVDISLLLSWDNIEIFRIFFILYTSFLSIIYVFYDILYLEIPEGIMKLLIFPLFIILALQTAFWINLLPFFHTTQNLMWLTQFISITASFIILLWFYIVMLNPLKNDTLDKIKDFWVIIASYLILFVLHKMWYDLSNIPILAWTASALTIFTFFFLQIILSNYKALWWWDLRIWIFMWLLLWLNYSLFWVICSYLFGSIIWLWVVFSQYIKQLESDKDVLNTMIPFGPFLAMWIFFTAFFYKDMANIFESLIIF